MMQIGIVFTISDPIQVLESLLMSLQVESGVLDEGKSAEVLQDSFKNHCISEICS